MHLVGHSLGAHLVGHAGKVFKDTAKRSLGRVTGLDPAGPRFESGPILSYIKELHTNRISTESASFVDIIHTEGSFSPSTVSVKPRSGDLFQLGHFDFYPEGGEAQPGCTNILEDAEAFGICSHMRAVYYYLASINEPKLFGAKECADAEACHEKKAEGDVVAYMGEEAK